MPRISELTDQPNPTGADFFPLVSAGSTRRATLSSLPISNPTAVALAARALLAGSLSQDFSAAAFMAASVTSTGPVIGTNITGSGTVQGASVVATGGVSGNTLGITSSATVGSLASAGDVTGTSLNTGHMAGFRNRIINGGFTVTQRAVANASATLGYSSADRWLVAATSGSAFTGQVTRVDSLGDTASGWWYGFSNCSWTGGQPTWTQRMEASHVADFGGKTVTVSFKYQQNTGVSRTLAVALSKPGARDDWSSSTTVNQQFSTTLASGVTNSLSFQFNLSSSEVANGLSLSILDSAPLTIATKSIFIGDVQIEIGNKATPFEFRFISTETHLCQRYFEAGVISLVAFQSAGSALSCHFGFKTTKRTVPTMAFTATTLTNTAGPISANTTSVDSTNAFVIATSGASTTFVGTYTASAEL